MEKKDIQKHILKKFMYSKDLTYNQIRTKELESNKFFYHLEKMINSGLIQKKDNLYNLTTEGMKLISSIDGVNFNDNKKPILCSFVLGMDKNKVLLNERKKQPFLGYVGIPGGKIDFGKNPEEQAKLEFLEETGLQGDLKLKVVGNYITFNENENKPNHHMVAFIYLATNLKGNLIEDNREGRNFFEEISLIEKHKCYPDIQNVINTVINSKSIKYLDIERSHNGEEFLWAKFK